MEGKIEAMISERGVSVRALAEKVVWKTFDYAGPEEYLMN